MSPITSSLDGYCEKSGFIGFGMGVLSTSRSDVEFGLPLDVIRSFVDLLPVI
jgi:hypothetical protein